MSTATARLSRLIPRSLRSVVRPLVVRSWYGGLRAHDALLVSYPKSGSTWLRFLLTHAITGVETDFDAVRSTFPPLGRHRKAPEILPGGGRAVRTHEPLRHYADRRQTRLVYLARDARPVALSYARHRARILGAPVDPADFAPAFLAGSVDSYGPWHEHVAAAMAVRDRHAAPFLLVRFEDLSSDTAGTVDRVLGFLGVPAVLDLDAVVAANTAERMRAKEQTSQLLKRETRDGSSFVGGGDRAPWESVVPVELRREFEHVVGSGLQALGYPLEFGSVR